MKSKHNIDLPMDLYIMLHEESGVMCEVRARTLEEAVEKVQGIEDSSPFLFPIGGWVVVESLSQDLLDLL